MSQVSYGTITITDTNDIESITVEYNRNQSPSDAPSAVDSGWSTTRPDWAQGYYIWQRTRVHKSGTTADTDVIGTAVCITGSTGSTGAPGRGLTDITTQYCNYGTGEPADDYSGWVDAPPNYDSSKPNYWVMITNTYSAAPTSEIIKYKDEALTKAVADAAIANSIATHANEDAQGAMSQAASNVNSVTRLWWSQATSTPVPSISTIITDGAVNRRGAWSNIRPTDDEAYPYYFYCDQTITGGGVASWSTVTLDTSTLSKYEIIATNVRTQNFFKGKDATYDGWFASGRSSDNGLKENDAETYYYNARFGATHIALGYNKTPVIDLDGSNGTINIYRFPTIDSTSNKVTSAGALGMRLSATDLIFYKPSVGNNSPVAAATLNANGLNIVDGSIELANGTNDSVKISNSDFARNINSVSRSNLRMAIGSKFGVKNDGTLYASNATISGAITATSLTLDSGVTVSTNNISGLSTVATSGSYNDLDNKPTIPSLTGYIHTDGTIGSTAAEGANSFTVASSGALTASNAIIYGTLYASKGYIGGWQIGTDGNKTLHNGSSNTSPTIGTGTIILSKGLTSTTSIAGSSGSQTWTIAAGTNFGVTTAGKLYATGAEISGDLTASSLKINGNNYLTDITTISSKASNNAEYEVVIKVNSIDYTNSSATLIAIPTKLGESTTGSFIWYKNAINTAHGGTVSTTTNTNDTLTVSDLEALYIAVLQ